MIDPGLHRGRVGGRKTIRKQSECKVFLSPVTPVFRFTFLNQTN
jgi:hypothetical protein